MSEKEDSAREHLPVFKTMEECVEYCETKQDGFYLTSFMIEAWIRQIICKTVEQYAGNKSGNRHLHTGGPLGNSSLVMRNFRSGGISSAAFSDIVRLMPASGKCSSRR